METTIGAPYLYDSKTTPSPHTPHSISEVENESWKQTLEMIESLFEFVNSKLGIPGTFG